MRDLGYYAVQYLYARKVHDYGMKGLILAYKKMKTFLLVPRVFL